MKKERRTSAEGPKNHETHVGWKEGKVGVRSEKSEKSEKSERSEKSEKSIVRPDHKSPIALSNQERSCRESSKLLLGLKGVSRGSVEGQ